MTDFPRDFQQGPPRLFARVPVDGWAVAIATALVVLIIAGVLPHVTR
ncbi:MAG: hypothetical protein ABI830_08040 [Pseudolabrys sp.]